MSLMSAILFVLFSLGEENSICADLEIALREQAPYLKTFREEPLENITEGNAEEKLRIPSRLPNE